MNNNFQIPKIDEFIENLIDASNYTDLLPTVRKEIKADLLRRLDEFVLAKMIAKFSDEDIKKFEDLLDKKASDEEIQNFGPEHIPQFTDFLTNTLVEFRQVYLGEIQTPTIVPPVTEKDTRN